MPIAVSPAGGFHPVPEDGASASGHSASMPGLRAARPRSPVNAQAGQPGAGSAESSSWAGPAVPSGPEPLNLAADGEAKAAAAAHEAGVEMQAPESPRSHSLRAALALLDRVEQSGRPLSGAQKQLLENIAVSALRLKNAGAENAGNIKVEVVGNLAGRPTAFTALLDISTEFLHVPDLVQRLAGAAPGQQAQPQRGAGAGFNPQAIAEALQGLAAVAPAVGAQLAQEERLGQMLNSFRGSRNE